MVKNNKGFTLAELIIVISIIGILASIIVVNVSSAREKARDAKRKSDLKGLQPALELYANAKKGQYPEKLEDLIPNYISELAVDQLAGKESCVSGGEKVICEYSYSNTKCDGSTDGNYYYSLRARLERKNDPELRECPSVGGGEFYIVEN